MEHYRSIVRCRECGSADLRVMLSLGQQLLTGVFPKDGGAVPGGPVDLMRCEGACGLVQLRQSYDLDAMYGDNYGYRSGLNPSMVEHLTNIARVATETVALQAGDVVLDIGSNDCTSLKAYPDNVVRIGMDPTGRKFREYYPKDVHLVADFFSKENFENELGQGRKARLVTSIAMFYDLEDPTNFMRQVSDVLAQDGLWIMEQSYLPAMLQSTSYDTICHEHLEFYGLKQIEFMADNVGLQIRRVHCSNVNGGSFQVWLTRADYTGTVEIWPEEERRAFLRSEEDATSEFAWAAFLDRISISKQRILSFVNQAKQEGKRVCGYGASTKGNVLLQYCGLGPSEIECIGEVNQDKYGCQTPGSCIPIISEAEMRARKPDYVLVLPWHFKEFIVNKEQDWLRTSGAKLLFPLPNFDIVGTDEI